MNSYLAIAGATQNPPQYVAANGNPPAYSAGMAIDQLHGTAISNPTITGGSISGTSIIGTISNAIATALATIDNLTSNTITATNVTFTNSTTSNASISNLAATNATTTNLAVTGTSTLAGVTLPNANCSSYGNGGKLTTDAFGDVYCAADQGGAGSTVAGADAQIQFNGGGSFSGSASFTFATSTGTLAVPNASTTNLSISNDAILGNATSTSLFSSIADFTSGIIGTLNASIANITGFTTTNFIATNATSTNLYAAASVISSLAVANASLANATTTSLGINSQTFTSLLGTGLTDASGALTVSLSPFSTLNLAEGTNLYFTPSRVASIIAGTTTDALAQGTTNKYFSNALAQGAISVSGAPLTYSSGVIGMNQANGSQAGFLASADWTNFNGKLGSSTIASLSIGYDPVWNGNAFSNGAIYDTGANIGIGTTTPGSIFSIANVANFTAATSTFYSTGGINLAAGCFAVAGNCFSLSNISGILGFGSGGTGTTSASGVLSVVNYISPASSTAVTRTLLSKLGDTLSVKDFGAKCDGTTDDTTAIQSAINVAETSPAGTESTDTVYIPAGTCIVSGVTVKSGVTIVGESQSSAILKSKSGSANPLITVATTYSGGTDPYKVGWPIPLVKISDLLLLGQFGAGASTSEGIWYTAATTSPVLYSELQIDHVTIYGSSRAVQRSLLNVIDSTDLRPPKAAVSRSCGIVSV